MPTIVLIVLEFLWRQRNNKKDDKTDQEIQKLRNLFRPPSPSLAGKGESTQWRPCLKEKFFLVFNHSKIDLN